MHDRLGIMRERARFVRYCLVGGALLALSIIAIARPGTTGAIVALPAGFCTISGAETSDPTYQIGFFTQRIEVIDAQPGSRSGASSCAGPDRTRVIVEVTGEATPIPSQTPEMRVPVALY